MSNFRIFITEIDGKKETHVFGSIAAALYYLMSYPNNLTKLEIWVATIKKDARMPFIDGRLEALNEIDEWLKGKVNVTS